MGYLHIPALYKDPSVLLFRRLWALEKIHGTSAHITWTDGRVQFSSGGANAQAFRFMFDTGVLKEKFACYGMPSVTVFGEAYGGHEQGQSHRYGDTLRFVAFDVRLTQRWLTVPDAAWFVDYLGLEFVSHVQVDGDESSITVACDAPSEQAKRNGVPGDVAREGVVLRPLVEMYRDDGTRIIAKHKQEWARETATQRPLSDVGKLFVIADAEAAAREWVTPVRLEHVLSSVRASHPDTELSIRLMREVISLMIENVLREGEGEIVDTMDLQKAISTRTAEMFKSILFEKT